MARGKTLRGISGHRVYTIMMAARYTGKSEATLRKGIKEGLSVITNKRPHLVRGADLIDFDERRRAKRKFDMAPTQFFCIGCSAAREPREGSLAYIPMTALTGRLSALCADCEGKVGRFCRASDAP